VGEGYVRDNHTEVIVKFGLFDHDGIREYVLGTGTSSIHVASISTGFVLREREVAYIARVPCLSTVGRFDHH